MEGARRVRTPPPLNPPTIMISEDKNIPTRQKTVLPGKKTLWSLITLYLYIPFVNFERGLSWSWSYANCAISAYHH